jgi:hypothetical protein
MAFVFVQDGLAHPAMCCDEFTRPPHPSCCKLKFRLSSMEQNYPTQTPPLVPTIKRAVLKHKNLGRVNLAGRVCGGCEASVS